MKEYKHPGNENNFKKGFSYAFKKEVVEQVLNGQMSKRVIILMLFSVMIIRIKPFQEPILCEAHSTVLTRISFVQTLL